MIAKSLINRFFTATVLAGVALVATQAPGAAQEGVTGAAITAGFEFDVPVRFDTDKLEINLQGFKCGAIPHIPIVEVRL